ncbi:carbohydrate ABC transporter permease [Aureibacillus halotolerans]|uniref:Carbohydrate ABC transporter membrane protein 2 (CUT1 family) n=1 Tax=Aureibacillus halotolerans TaxID=1508390 RepID=A0A4R6U5S6_9BACI|nr:carbohydrate ABC transporter permease [Aureibacillus halotolerans]TDQ40912.1 carbohydrate ABC transporter membrane protein 2 (CUT1 family) [Aureibacillus halotolerans]
MAQQVAVEKQQKTLRHRKPILPRLFIYISLSLLAIVCIVPFYIMIIYATHSNADIASKFIILPGQELITNFQRMSASVNIGRGFMNSLIIAGSTTIITLYCAALNGYGFAKFHFKGRNVLFVFVLATMMVPMQLGLIGNFKLMATLKLLDTHAAIILPSAANAFAVFFLKQFIESSIPDSVIESGRIDGAGELKIFNRIILPMLLPPLSALGIFSFIGAWNNFITPLVLLFSQDKYPLPVLVAMMQDVYSTDYGLQYLGVALSVIPIIIVFSIFSRQIMGGVAIGSVKG